MKDIRPPLTVSIVSSIQDIPRQDWDRLFGRVLIEGYDYQKSLEDAGMNDFSFGYVTGSRDNEIKIIIPFFVVNFSFETIIGPPFHKLAHTFRKLMQMKVLFLGTPTTERFYLGISKDIDLKEAINKILPKIHDFCKQARIKAMLFYNLSKNDKPLAEHLARKKFIEMESLPSTIIKIDAGSLDEYINSLSSNMRKDIKKKLRRSEGKVSLRTETRNNVDDIYGEIYKLYMNNFSDSDVHFEVLSPRFFRDICHNMPDTAKYFITYAGEKIVAFNLCLVKGDLCLDKFIGFDLNVAHDYHLYFTTFCYNIDWCIRNGIRFYQPGVTDYHPKIRLGAKLIPLYIYARSFNPLLNIFVRMSARFIQPRNLDSSLKDIKWFEKDGEYF